MSDSAQPPYPRNGGDGPEENFAPARRPRDSVGSLLRQARLSYGVDINSTAAALRIRPAYLAAIENGEHEALPGPVYALGFVRAYANYLGLDGDEAVRRFRLESAGLDRPRDLAFPMPLSKRSVPGGPMLLAAFVLAVCGYGLWYYLSTGDHTRPELVAAVPTQLLPPPAPPSSPTAAEAAESPGPNPAPASSAALTAAPASVVALPDAAVAVPVPMPPGAGTVTAMALAPQAGTSGSAPAAPAPVQPAVALDGRVFGAVDAPARIIIHATSDSWVQVSDAGATVVAQRLLHQGDSYRVPEQPGLVLRTGNASGLQITIDGRPVKPIGGTVRHNILLDPNKLLAGTAAAE